MHYFHTFSILAAGVIATAITVQSASAHAGATHPHPVNSIWSSELLGILGVALVVLIVYRLTNARPFPPEDTSAWQAGPVLPGASPERPATLAPTRTETGSSSGT